jgi:hypothetical protein
MAAQRKRKTRTVVDEGYSKLDEYAIWLHEYHRALRRAGFSNDNALWLVATRESFPDWVEEPTINDIRKHIEGEEDE